MKTNEKRLAGVALCCIAPLLAFTSCTAPQTAATQGTSPITWTTKGKPTGKMDVLYVQNGKSVSLEKGKLVLRGVNSSTVCFTDRPARLAGHLPTKDFVPLWSQGKDSFLKDPPNATLSIFSANKVSDVVVEISNPVLSGNSLSYNAKVLEGADSISGGECTLFIDIIGCPAPRILTLGPQGVLTVDDLHCGEPPVCGKSRNECRKYTPSKDTF